jgi:hypothetical protein
MPSKLESIGPPDEDRRITQVAGPTEVAVCEGVVITRIQPTPKSFRVNTGDVGALQARSNAWRAAQLKITVRVHQHVRRRDAYIRRACVRELLLVSSRNKAFLSKHHGIAQLSARRLLVLRHGPSARLQGVAIVASRGMLYFCSCEPYSTSKKTEY